MSTTTTSAVARFAHALQAFDRGDWPTAMSIAESVVVALPNAAQPFFIAGVSALQMGRAALAVARLGRACQLDPRRGDYLAQHARALAIAGDLPRAAVVAREAMRLPTLDDPRSFDTLGIVLDRAALHGEAAVAFARAVALAPAHPGYRYNLGTSLMFHGDLAGAEREYEECLRLDPRHWRADLSISQLRRQDSGSNHVERLGQRLSSHGSDPEARMYLHLALAKEHEDLGDTGAAFDHYSAGKRVLAARSRPLVDLAERCVEQLLERHGTRISHGDGHPSGEPIFIIGMPRSGTTLVDRILSSHDDVYSAGELDNFGMQLRRLAPRPAGTLLQTALALPPGFSDWRALGRAYVESTRPATGRTPRFTDKHPLNFLFVADIARALPNARFVCLRRNPMDTCLSNFRQLFATEVKDYDYSYDLLSTGRYYLEFDRLMRHWHAVLPGRILEVDYETLVDAPEATIRRLLGSCGLPWQDACLHFERNPAAAASASAAQVRSPLNRASLQRWKRYGAVLDPLRELLEAGGIDVSDDRTGANGQG